MPSASGPRHVSRMREAIAGDPAIASKTARGGSISGVDFGQKMHRFLTAVWEELGLWFPLTVSNALEHPMWRFYDRLAGSRDLATVRVHKRLSGCDGSEAVKSFRPSTARRYPPVGLTRPSPAGPACAGDPETKREKSVCVLPYKAHARRDQKCDYRKHQRASPMPRDSLQSPSWTPWTPFEASA